MGFVKAPDAAIIVETIVEIIDDGVTYGIRREAVTRGQGDC